MPAGSSPTQTESAPATSDPSLATAGAPQLDPADVTVFRRRLLAHSASQLPDHDEAALADIARAALTLGMVRRPGETLIRVHPGGADVTDVDVITDDVPYLVDSMRSELARRGTPSAYVLHPQLVVSRNADGRLTAVHDVDDTGQVPSGAIVESWTRIELAPLTEPERDRLVADLRRVLADVHNAVADGPAMYAEIEALAERLTTDPGEFDRDASAEAGALLRWLADGNFHVLGYTCYSANELADPRARSQDHHAMGVLRGELSISPLELLPAFRSGAPLVIFKSPLVSTVRRSARFDCVTVMAPAGDGEGQAVHVFLGLITVLENGVGRVPVVRRRIAEILERSGVRAESHSGRQLLAALRTLPRDELLEAPASDLLRLAQLVVDRAERHAVGVFARIHLNRDFVSVLVYLPADRFGPDVRRRVRAVIERHWPGEVIGRDDRIVELDFARMHFLIAVRSGTQPPSPDRPAVEREVAGAIRRWTDDLRECLTARLGEEEAQVLYSTYADALPEAYKEDFDPRDAVDDLRTLHRLPELDGLGFALYTPGQDDVADRRLKVFRTGRPISLATALPYFAQMGLEVLDERPYEIDLVDHDHVWIYDFGLRLPGACDFTDTRAANVVSTIELLWRGRIENDGFNALVVRGELSWWQANLLRAYAKYLRQAGTAYSQGYIERALIEHPGIACALVNLFEQRFDPSRPGPGHSLDLDDSDVHHIEQMLSEVASLDQDTILRSLLALINATLRTNAYRTDEHGHRRETLAIKLDPQRVPSLPAPRPRFEIWVHSPRVEGVHLRFGPVARGGLRWSDRREDFRTEILGLVKAQTVKNAVIVPTGAKGGFVCKQLPDPAVDREAWLAEGIACYRAFVSSLLDVTDNSRRVVDGGRVRTVVVPPPDVRRLDGDDTYLVVAADKGTASFSDIANGIAADYDFWLGDAFASGGSVGYDHKAMGITARGAWESVKYHFRELGIDTQTQDFTVVGVGDMSGDVFGNGMLLSEHIRLMAAFDHRHIFLDPEPDAARSFAERQRLFDLPRSSWADYDESKISAGGGVYPRTAKQIPISPQARRALGLPDGVTSLTPPETIRAILLAPVDLLWNGGIGTYVKAAGETNQAVGDKANDPVRVNGRELRVRVVGEGGNLGFTQLGRVEFTAAGGRINTDAIDNSAGVDTSDHEVNIKILLDRAVAAGRIDREERNAILLAATDEVGALVLRDNYEQNVLLGMARVLSPSMRAVHQRVIGLLEEAGSLDRALEFLPSDPEFARRDAAGYGLLSPENAVLIAYVKIRLEQLIERSTLPDEPWFQRALAGYFPKSIAERFADELPTHPLHREIITTVVVNDMINRSGTTFVHRAMEETGADAAMITRAYSVVREVFGLEPLWAEIESLDNLVPTDAQHAGYAEIRRLIDRATRWFVDVRYPINDIAGEIARFGPTLAELGPRITSLVRGSELADIENETVRLTGLGLPRNLALRLAELLSMFLLLDIVEIADSSRHSAAEIAELHFALSDLFYVDEMLTAVTHLPRDDRWSTLARAAIRHDVYAALSAITTAVIQATDQGANADDRVAQWRASNVERVERARTTVRAALDREVVDLATLSVALRVMRSVP
jgi:glutamate dehydrogenase